ncbi:hypothetical protein ACFE04_005850 [Oxalis oulophora]
MDLSESHNIVFDRIKKLEPDNAAKIITYLTLQEHDEHTMDEWATSPDFVIQKLIYQAKVELRKLSLKPKFTTQISHSLPPIHFSHFSSRISAFSPPRTYQPSIWEPPVAKKHTSGFMPQGYWDSITEMENQDLIFCLEEQMADLKLRNHHNGYYSETALGNHAYQYSPKDFPVKTCHYFNKGFCKHGNNCRYFHGQVPESYPQIFRHHSVDGICNDRHARSLEKLEMEIVELLKSRRGSPVSIASLPTIYFEKYGKNIQAEGYLTESQRHGKAGYSLTKLLAKLKHSIRLIDRPHGQHAVILAEDAPKYMESRNERNDPGPIVSGSRQLYLTFPADSTFTEDDVSNYFSTYGPVEDVRIPCQHERMYGFVTFASSNTVQTILSKDKSHFVCGARVLVKPYREKTKLVDRKYRERYDSSVYYPPHYVDMDFDMLSTLKGWRRHLMEERERAFELERKRLAELQFSRKSFANYSYAGYSIDCLKASEEKFKCADHLDFPSAERFNCVLDVLNNGSTDEGIWHPETTCTDQDRVLEAIDAIIMVRITWSFQLGEKSTTRSVILAPTNQQDTVTDQLKASTSPGISSQTIQESMRLLLFVRAYQVNGHMKAKLDPLNLEDRVIPDDLILRFMALRMLIWKL